MTRKRRMFQIDIPEEAVAPPAPSGNSARRGPMASAIAENAEALQARKTAAEQIREENDALAHEFVALREAGHVVQRLPLDQVHCAMLVRDRMPGEDVELGELVTSIRDTGLSNPIRVLPRPDGGGYELVQGYRRLGAYRALYQETEAEDWAEIPALIMPGAPDVAGLYRRMVDENVIRKDLSFAEMARAAQVYAEDPSTSVSTAHDAVAELFQSAPYSKRSYIRLFAVMLEHLGEVLFYPTEIPRALGIELGRALKTSPDLARRIAETLKPMAGRDPDEEIAVLRELVGIGHPAPPAREPAERKGRASRTKTTFHIRSNAGQVKCTAAQGRLEIKVDRDFSSIERKRLEQAITALIDGLE